MQLEPSNDKQAAAIKLRDREQREFYNDRVIKRGGKDATAQVIERVYKTEKDEYGEDIEVAYPKKVQKRLITDNFEYKTENTVDKNGKTVSEKVFSGGYQVVIND